MTNILRFFAFQFFFQISQNSLFLFYLTMANNRARRTRLTVDEVLLDDSDSEREYFESGGESDSEPNNGDSDIESESDTEGDQDIIEQGGAGDNRPAGPAVWTKITVANDEYIPVWCPRYNRRHGPQFPEEFGDGAGRQPIDFFMLLFPEEAFQVILDATVKYGDDCIRGIPGLNLKDRFKDWEKLTLTVNHIKAYVGLQIRMGIVSKFSISL